MWPVAPLPNEENWISNTVPFEIDGLIPLHVNSVLNATCVLPLPPGKGLKKSACPLFPPQVVQLTSFGLRVPVPEKPPPNWILRNWLEATVPVKSKLKSRRDFEFL